jgi:hypothetical protein
MTAEQGPAIAESLWRAGAASPRPRVLTTAPPCPSTLVLGDAAPGALVTGHGL